MKNSKIILIFLLIILPHISLGCINQQGSYVSYSIYVTPDENSETTLIVPVVIDKKSGEIDEVMNVEPRFPKGSAFLEIIKTENGSALKLTASEEVEIDFSKSYKESGAEIRANKTLSMTSLTYGEQAKPMMISWTYANSTTNRIPQLFVSLHAGDSDRVRVLRLSGVNVTNGWHQFTVEEGYGIS